MGADGPVIEHRAVESRLVLADYSQTEESVIKEDSCSLRYIVDEAGVIHINHLPGAGCCRVRLDLYLLVCLQLNRCSVSGSCCPDLRSLGVHHNGDAVADSADVVDHSLKSLMSHMG